MKKITKAERFQWDKGNNEKNWQKHKITNQEAEQAFFDREKINFKDRLHSIHEERYILLGKTKAKRLLYVVYTRRKEKIRIISARDINKKEVYVYEKKTRTTKV